MRDDSVSPGEAGIEAAGVTDTGRCRDQNEDSLLIRHDLHLYAVADGAGGHNAGEIASALTVRSIENYFEATEELEKGRPEYDQFGLLTQCRRVGASIHKANRDVMEASRASTERRGMGATVVLAYVRPKWRKLYLGHLGDSRCYRLRGGYLEQLTHDHTMINEVMELRPNVDAAVLERLPITVVTRAIGMGDKVRVALRAYEIAKGDRFLLCSDGLYADLLEEVLRRVLRSPEGPHQVAKHLVRAANDAGGGDNITALVIDVERSVDDRIVPSERAGAAELVHGSKPRKAEGPSPEILALGIESDVDVEPKKRVKSIPDRFDEGMREAVEEFVAPIWEATKRRSESAKLALNDPEAEATAPAENVGPAQMPWANNLAYGPEKGPAEKSENQGKAPDLVVDVDEPRVDFSKQKKCVACSKTIPASARFCPYCGEIRTR